MGIDLVGAILGGKYRLTRHLGSGGMGDVYLAHHEELDRVVAIKVLNGRHSAEHRQRFLREAKILSRLNHPHIVQVYDFGQTPNDAAPYLVMEHIDGEDLREILTRERALSAERTTGILSQLAAALAAAHRATIAHLDFKPENIMLSRGKDGRDVVKVLDFGIARTTDPEGTQDSVATQTGAVLGTPAYISPEQIRGVRDDVRSDLYALGLVAYEMLSGRLPYQAATTAELVVHHLTTEPIPLQSVVADPLPVKLVAWIHGLLAKSPDARPRDGTAALSALEDALQDDTRRTSTMTVVTPPTVETTVSSKTSPSLTPPTPETPAHASPALRRSRRAFAGLVAGLTLGAAGLVLRGTRRGASESSLTTVVFAADDSATSARAVDRLIVTVAASLKEVDGYLHLIPQPLLAKAGLPSLLQLARDRDSIGAEVICRGLQDLDIDYVVMIDLPPGTPRAEEPIILSVYNARQASIIFAGDYVDTNLMVSDLVRELRAETVRRTT